MGGIKVSHMRIDPISKETVIISENRLNRPTDLSLNNEKVDFKKECPFCVNNEGDTGLKVYEDREDYGVKVVENKYPIILKKQCTESDIYGFHYVVIEGKNHSENFYEFNKNHIAEIIRAYMSVSRDIYESKFIKYVQIFKNHGKGAGASLRHSHSQIVGMNVMPEKIKTELENSRKYYMNDGNCPFCDLLKKELQSKERVVYENEGFVAICPYVSTHRYEIQIMKRKHSSTLLTLNEAEINDLSDVLKVVTNKLNSVLGNDISYNIYYNFIKEDNKYYHFYVKICPRMVNGAGFEISTGIMVNTILPEVAAKRIREAKY